MGENKKGIIVEEIDVSKCKYFDRHHVKDKLMLCTIASIGEDCLTYSNCYFKQVHRMKKKAEATDGILAGKIDVLIKTSSTEELVKLQNGISEELYKRSVLGKC